MLLVIMDLKPCQQAILVDLCVFRDDKAANVGRRTNYHRNTVSKHLTILVDEGYLHQKGGGVHRLTDKGLSAAQGLIRGGYNPYVDTKETD